MQRVWFRKLCSRRGSEKQKSSCAGLGVTRELLGVAFLFWLWLRLSQEVDKMIKILLDTCKRLG